MNWFDILIIIVAIYSIFKGYRSGFVKQLASLVAIIACILISGKVSSILLPYIQDRIPANWAEPAAFITSFLLIFAVVMILGHMLQSILETVKMGTLNKMAGAVLSLAKWMLVVSIIFNLLSKMDENHTLIDADLKEKSKTYQYIQPLAPAITPYLSFNWIE
ncbi:MAG: CvpA family protein [Dysgonomonas sp.]|nr:CvpA family protein [Dysgonomonas sp.]